MTATLLVLNTGSSSVKFQVFDAGSLEVLLSGKVTGIGTQAVLKAQVTGKPDRIDNALGNNDHHAALAAVIDLVDAHDDGWILRAVVHRVVHGGTAFTAPVIVTPEIMGRLAELNPLAPLHQPHNLAGIAAARGLAPDAPNIACFDTAFHAGHSPLVSELALPQALRDRGMRRYGFHGISYQWIARRLAEDHPDLAAGRIVAAHLGNGASLCAISAGRSIDTTMGMTALDGLPMGTRSGAIDPGAVTYMMRELGMDAAGIEHVLYEQSGLKGLSGLSNDVQTLLSSTDPRAAFALDVFALNAAKFVAAMAVSMGGLDGLVFTGGIGENAEPVRKAILERLAFLPPFPTLVIAADEERMMAIEAIALLRSGP